MKTSLNRTEVAYLQNKSGGPLIQGDVAVISGSNSEAVVTTTTSGYVSGLVVVTLDASIANNAYGAFAVAGYVPKINLSSSASLGNLFYTHTVAKQAVPHVAPLLNGDFGMVLGAGTSPSALLVALPASVISAPGYVLVRDEKPSGTLGGTFTSGSWVTRVINTEVNDTGNYCSIASNQITLELGTYECSLSVPAYGCGRHRAKLYNISDSSNELFGSVEYCNGTGGVATSSKIVGRFAIAAQKIFEIRHRCEVTAATHGLGVESNFGDIEIYTQAEFWKVG